MAKRAEGSEEQKQAAAREAKRQGKRPSEVGVTTGASKQRKSVRGGASHEERFETEKQGKLGAAGEGQREQSPHPKRD
jgi:hypothetical protein